MQYSCQIAQFLRSKNRQKSDKFFHQISDFCENCNLHSYHTTTIGLVDIWFAETCKLTLFTFLKIFICLKNRGLLHAQTGSLSMQVCMFHHTVKPKTAIAATPLTPHNESSFAWRKSWVPSIHSCFFNKIIGPKRIWFQLQFTANF